MWWLVLAACSTGPGEGDVAPQEDPCLQGTDPWDCGVVDTDTDTDTDPDTDWDTQPLPLDPDPDIDTEVCQPTHQPQQVEYGGGTPPDSLEWCVMAQTSCVTWSQMHARSREQCVQSAVVAGCSASFRTIQFDEFGEFHRYFDAAGVLIATRATSDTNLQCESSSVADTDTGETLSALVQWTGQRLVGCDGLNVRMSASCLPDRGRAWSSVGGASRAPRGPATLAVAMEELGETCYGVARCADDLGTLVVSAADAAVAQPNEGPFWYYNSDGVLAGSYSSSYIGGQTPGRCQGAVIEHSLGCGFAGVP